MKPSQKHITIGALILAAIGVGVYAYQNRVVIAPSVPADSMTSATTSDANTSTDTLSTSMPGAVPATIYVGQKTKTPSLSAPLIFSDNVSAEVRTALQSQFSELVAKLSKNTNQMDLWLLLGTLRKIAGDYTGAIEDWGFVARDGNSVAYIAYGNLADLYMNFVKDYPKAESSYLAAIDLEPAYIDFYRGLFSLYSNVYKKGTSAAEDILKKGITANPKAVDLQVTLAQYYVSLGRTADAKAEYDAAIANAKSQGLTQLAAQLQAEKADL